MQDVPHRAEEVATVTSAPSAVRTRAMLTRGRGGPGDRGLFRVTVAGIAEGLALAFVTTGCGAGALPPHPASAQHPASTLAASVLPACASAMLSDMCLEATGLDDTDMKAPGPRRSPGYRGPPSPAARPAWWTYRTWKARCRRPETTKSGSSCLDIARC